MKNGQLRIIKPGILTLIQDLGRIGGQNIGLTQSGAADLHAFNWSNKLLDNPKNTPALEITMGGLEVEFTAPTLIANCGADVPSTINGKKINNWSTHKVYSGDTLKLGYAQSGLRHYISVRGGLLLNGEICSSFSSVEREQLGFNEGQSLNIGQEISYNFTNHIDRQITRMAPPRFIPDYGKPLELSIYPTYQFNLFNEKTRKDFENTVYHVGNSSNRMGYRLTGKPVKCEKSDIISEGIAFGAVQIPADGQPIVLLSDRQTIGGYPKIGCVTRESCYQLAQRRPGQEITFKWVDFDS